MTTERREELLVFRLQRPALIGGGAAIVLCLLSALLVHDGPTHFLRAYLVGTIFIFTLTIGTVGVLAMQYLTGGLWGVMVRKSLEASARTLPIVALAFIPLLLGLNQLYPWADEQVVAHDHLLQKKIAYLNEPFFIGRTAFYFSVWTVIALFLVRWSKQFEETGSPLTRRRLSNVGAASLVLMALTLTFAAVDWVMSLEPHWYSTMYGISFMVGSILSGLAFVTLVATLLSQYEPLAEIFRPLTYRDLGNLMLAFVMLWAYTAFSQFMLIWYGNLREEVPYYVPRTQGGWGVVAVMLIVFHFFLPFGLLLMREIKDRPRTLGAVAGLILIMRLMDHVWMIVPAFRPHGASPGEEHLSILPLAWMVPLAVIGLAGLWLALFLWQLERRPLIPRNEPVLEEAISHG